jgi:hypothetical protein
MSYTLSGRLMELSSDSRWAGSASSNAKRILDPVGAGVGLAAQDVQVVVAQDLPHVHSEAGPVERLDLDGGREAAGPTPGPTRGR